MKKAKNILGSIQGIVMNVNDPWVTLMTDDARILCINWLLAREADPKLPELSELKLPPSEDDLPPSELLGGNN